jgi:5-methylcytosine-specific restriction endonuclease McrA
MEYVEHKHFSECLEFVQHTGIKPKPPRKSIPPKLRFQILKRDNYTCIYCGKSSTDGAELHVDHKTSIKDGGTDDPDNLVTSCTACNFGKGADSIP